MKKDAYFSNLSIQQYIIVDENDRLIDVYTRTEQGWMNELIADTGVLSLSAVGVELSLDTIYEDTELDATRRPAGERPAPAA